MGNFDPKIEKAVNYYRIVFRRWMPDEFDRRLFSRRNVAEAEKQAAEAAYPRDLKRVRIEVNDDCPAPEWWVAARASADCPTRWLLRRFDSTSAVVAETDDAARFLAWAETIPGWSSGPESPHPLLAEPEPKRILSPDQAACSETLVSLVVDGEVNAEDWWAEARERAEKCRNAGFTAFLRDHMATSFTCERAEAVRLLVWCASLPEWEGGDPLVLCESEPEGAA